MFNIYIIICQDHETQCQDFVSDRPCLQTRLEDRMQTLKTEWLSYRKLFPGMASAGRNQENGGYSRRPSGENSVSSYKQS